MLSIKEKTEIIISELNNKLIEREDIIPILLLTIFSKSHMLLLGPPGVGKTYAIELISNFVENLKYFEYLITNKTTLEELFGTQVVDSDGSMIYNIEKSMLDSHICFIDELYKAPSNLINSLLGITHSSRSFYQRGRGKLKSPMISMFAASNELPESDVVDAFDDRILFRFWVDEIRNIDNFKRFAKRDFDRTKTFSQHINSEELLMIEEKSKEIFIHDDFVTLYADIRTKLSTEKVRISDRKLQSSLDIFQTSAYVNGRDYVDLSELFLLMDIAWKHFDDIDRVKRIIFNIIFGVPSNIKKVLKDNQDNYKMIISKLRSNTGKILDYSYNFYTSQAEDEFRKYVEEFKFLKEQVDIIYSNCESLKDNYLFAKKMEDMIANNIFVKNYKNHIYNEVSENNSEVVDKNKVNKDHIFDLLSDVELQSNKLNNWLINTPELYDYNNIKIEKGR